MAPTPPTPEDLSQLIADEKARHQSKFAELEKFREVIRAEVESGTSQRLIVRCLQKLGVAVSLDTLGRYVRHTGFHLPKPARRKRAA